MLCATLSRIRLVVPVLVLLAACRTVRPERAALRYTRAEPSSSRGSDALECGEIRSAGVADAYEAVMRFRPEFLRPRGGLAATDLEVGLVLHFGKKPRFHRVFFENQFKQRNK